MNVRSLNFKQLTEPSSGGAPKTVVAKVITKLTRLHIRTVQSNQQWLQVILDFTALFADYQQKAVVGPRSTHVKLGNFRLLLGL